MASIFHSAFDALHSLNFGGSNKYLDLAFAGILGIGLGIVLYYTIVEIIDLIFRD